MNNLNTQDTLPTKAPTPQSSSLARRTQEFLDLAVSVHGDKYDYSKVNYVRAQDKVEIVCKVHNTSFFQLPFAHAKNGHGCPTCGREKCRPQEFSTRLTQAEFLTKCRAHHGEYYYYGEVVYTGLDNDITITCLKHGKFTQKARNHYSGSGCASCALEGLKKDSSTNPKVTVEEPTNPVLINVLTLVEKEKTATRKSRTTYEVAQAVPEPDDTSVVDFIRSLGFSPLVNDTATVMGMALDIVIPELNVAIDYNTLFNNSEQVGKGRDYHLRRLKALTKAGYRFLQIFQDEWVNKQSIVKSRLTHILGKDVEGKAYARKLEVRDCSPQAARDFFNTYHVQGTCGASQYYGLFQGDDMLACISFGKNRFTKDSSMELIRYATKVNVVGGFSKLLKHFIRMNPEVKALSSYSDRRWSVGNVYAKNGFVEVAQSQASYFYVKQGEIFRHNRVKYQLHKLADKLEIFDSNKTEIQNVLANGYFRVFDCGCQKWVMTIQ